MSLNLEQIQDKEVYIFGAGLSGQSAYEKLKDKTRIKGFLDNNAQNADIGFTGLTIQTPHAWFVSNEPFDFILIASEHFESISQQLQNDFSVPEERIVVLPTRITKPVNLGQSDDLKANAYKILFLVTQIFETKRVNYYVDAGTLLGIHRDGKLIPWDDDIDIAVNAADMDGIRNVLDEAVEVLSQIFGTPWTVDAHYANCEFGAVPDGAIRGFKVRPLESSENLPMIDLFVKYVDGALMDYTLSSRGIRMPSEHLLKTALVHYREQPLRFPFNVEGYLTAHYGDWRTPMKDWDLSMLQNATVY